LCCSPFRGFCPKIRRQLGVIVEKFLHGYDEEEICFSMKMCPHHMIQVWKPGDPTTASGAALKTMGIAGKEGAETRVLL